MASTLDFLIFYCLTPVYIGSGESGRIDLKIQRNPVTGLPWAHSTSVKGALRAYLEGKISNNAISSGFGEKNRMGNMSFLDTELLLFPVKYERALFAYIASPGQLLRVVEIVSATYEKDYRIKKILLQMEESLEEGEAYGPVKEEILLGNELYSVDTHSRYNEIVSWLGRIVSRFSNNEYILHRVEHDLFILSDADFKDMVDSGLMRVARINLDENKRVKPGGLFFQELLPEYSILYMPIISRDSCASETIYNALSNEFLCIGGSESIGRSFVKVVRIRGCDMLW